MTPEQRKLSIVALNSAWLMRHLGWVDEGVEEPGFQLAEGMVCTPLYDFPIEKLAEYDLTPGSYLDDQETARINREEIEAAQPPFELLDDERYARFDVEACLMGWGFELVDPEE